MPSKHRAHLYIPSLIYIFPRHYTNEFRIISSLISWAYNSLNTDLFSSFYRQFSLTKYADLFIGDVSTRDTSHRTRNSH